MHFAVTLRPSLCRLTSSYKHSRYCQTITHQVVPSWNAVAQRSERKKRKTGSWLLYYCKCHLCQGIVLLAHDSIPIDIIARVGDVLGLDECSKVALSVDLGDVVNLNTIFKSVGVGGRRPDDTNVTGSTERWLQWSIITHAEFGARHLLFAARSTAS